MLLFSSAVTAAMPTLLYAFGAARRSFPTGCYCYLRWGGGGGGGTCHVAHLVHVWGGTGGDGGARLVAAVIFVLGSSIGGQQSYLCRGPRPESGKGGGLLVCVVQFLIHDVAAAEIALRDAIDERAPSRSRLFC